MRRYETLVFSLQPSTLNAYIIPIVVSIFFSTTGPVPPRIEQQLARISTDRWCLEGLGVCGGLHNDPYLGLQGLLMAVQRVKRDRQSLNPKP